MLMRNLKSTTKSSLIALAGLFFGLGIYNSVVINSTEFLNHDHPKFVKRLDEMNGEYKVGRIVANQGMWVNLGKIEKPSFVDKKQFAKINQANQGFVAQTSTEEQIQSQAAIKEDLELNVTEVFSATKFPNALKGDQISGGLKTKDGLIESLGVSLPNGESISIDRAEMVGNVFEYESNGEELTGMIYAKGNNAYMVVLTNGPFEGTRMSFEAAKSEEEVVVEAAEPVQAEEARFEPIVTNDGTSMPVGQFGAPQTTEPSADVAYIEPENNNENVTESPVSTEQQSYGFNFEQNPELN
jgi:hypothetical protein